MTFSNVCQNCDLGNSKVLAIMPQPYIPMTLQLKKKQGVVNILVFISHVFPEQFFSQSNKQACSINVPKYNYSCLTNFKNDFFKNQMSCQHSTQVMYIFFFTISLLPTHKNKDYHSWDTYWKKMMTSYWHTLKQTPIIIVFLPSRHGLYAHCSIDNIPFSLCSRISA